MKWNIYQFAKLYGIEDQRLIVAAQWILALSATVVLFGVTLILGFMVAFSGGGDVFFVLVPKDAFQNFVYYLKPINANMYNLYDDMWGVGLFTTIHLLWSFSVSVLFFWVIGFFIQKRIVILSATICVLLYGMLVITKLL